MSFIKYLFGNIVEPFKNLYVLTAIILILFGFLIDAIFGITLFVILFPFLLFILLIYLDYKKQTRLNQDDKL